MKYKLIEKKDHIINKMPMLSSGEKQAIITYFNSHPNDESKIDWNKASTLTFSDFETLLKSQSKKAKKRAIKQTGIKGLTEGEEYVTVYEQPYEEIGGSSAGTIMGYVPLNWEASKIIASKYVGTTEDTGEWCVAYQKDPQYWNQYCGDEDSFFIYFVDYAEIGEESLWGKVAVRVMTKGRTDYEVWNKEDHKIYSTVGSSFHSRDTDYPEFLFDKSAMKEIIIEAHQKAEYAGGVQADQTKNYEISVNAYGEVKEGILFGSVSYQQMSWSGDGDYDVEDDGDSETYSSFTIYPIDQSKEMDSRMDFVNDLKEFNVRNGKGIVIEYENDHTPDQAQEAASRRWDGDMNSDPDLWDLEREMKQLISEDIDYVIMFNDIDIDDILKYVIRDTERFPFGMYGEYGDRKPGFGVMNDEDSEGNMYNIYYRNGYDYQSNANKNDWVTNPSQRKYDRQLDLPYGL